METGIRPVIVYLIGVIRRAQEYLLIQRHHGGREKVSCDQAALPVKKDIHHGFFPRHALSRLLRADRLAKHAQSGSRHSPTEATPSTYVCTFALFL